MELAHHESLFVNEQERSKNVDITDPKWIIAHSERQKWKKVHIQKEVSSALANNKERMKLRKT